MNQLIIKLKGEIQSSNFAEWKNELIAQIQSVNTQLMTDDDFVAAIEYVKLLKSAEKTLKTAKQSSINQAADIQKLFAAIDDISEQARQTRLSLEHQIDRRKFEIKQQCIQSGIDIVQAFIQQQNKDFQFIDHAEYIDRHRFEAEIKGKGSIKSIQAVMNGLCRKIKIDISQKATEVTRNGVIIDTLPSQYKILCQDRPALLALNTQELRLTIEKRIAVLNEEEARRRNEQAIHELKKIEDVELNTNVGCQTEKMEIVAKQKYRLTIDICSAKNTAIEIARAIRQEYGQNVAILSIRLNYNDDER